MNTLNIREMRAALGQLDQLLDEKQEIILTRRGKAIARVLPMKPRRQMPSHADLRSRTPKLPSSAPLIRADRDERG